VHVLLKFHVRNPKRKQYLIGQVHVQTYSRRRKNQSSLWNRCWNFPFISFSNFRFLLFSIYQSFCNTKKYVTLLTHPSICSPRYFSCGLSMYIITTISHIFSSPFPFHLRASIASQRFLKPLLSFFSQLVYLFFSNQFIRFVTLTLISLII